MLNARQHHPAMSSGSRIEQPTPRMCACERACVWVGVLASESVRERKHKKDTVSRFSDSKCVCVYGNHGAERNARNKGNR